MPVISRPTTFLFVCLLAALPCAGFAQESLSSTQTAPGLPNATLEIFDADGFEAGEYLWSRRVLAVFADTPADPRFIKQMELLHERPRDLVERDVVVVIDTDPAAKSAIRRQLRPRGFALVMIDKDGDVKLRKPSPWSTREIARSIDKTPLRRQEIRERLDNSG